uniref:TACI cysteine-rich domain-containing protein n=1 Tax=Sinocyclocheilus grahami TaxID=75366 RepID=A0A672MC12_SINGR
MAQSCPEGQYMDRLLRECVSCSMICHDSVIPTRCSQYCGKCKAVSGQFYDTLLKKCLKCSELCGSHPEASVFVTQRPDVGGSAVQLVPGRGRSVSGSALYSEALLYSLLGLCIIVLLFSLTAAFLLLLKRAKHQPPLDTKKQQPNKHGQSSEGKKCMHVMYFSKNIECFWFNFYFIYHYILWKKMNVFLQKY